MSQGIKRLNDRYVSEEVITNYSARMKFARMGQTAFSSDDLVEALRQYNNYINAIARYKNKRPYELSPDDFDSDEDLSEMLLLSHVYWDLAKIFDLSDNLENNFESALKQFVLFTAGRPYQVVNTELIRKYIKKGSSKNIKAFEVAHKEILRASRRCVLATKCFSEDHPITNELREFKNSKLVNSKIGLALIDRYYRSSEIIVSFIDRNPLKGRLLVKCVIRPAVTLTYLLIKRR